MDIASSSNLMIFEPQKLVKEALGGITPVLGDEATKSFSFNFTGKDLQAAAETVKDGLFNLAFGFEILAGVITLILLVIFIWILLKIIKSNKKAEKPRERETLVSLDIARNQIKENWSEITRRSESPSEAEWKLAIIEADKLMDFALEKFGFMGETMGDKLKSVSKNQIKSLNSLWDAHKLRNLLVHNTQFKIKQSEVIYAVEQYKKALRELGFLE